MRYPLRYVIPVMLLVIGLLAAAAVALTSVRMSNESTDRIVTNFLTTIGNQAASDVAAGLRRDNPARIRNAIEQLQVLRGMTLALLVDSNNEIAYSTQTSYVGRAIDRQIDPQFTALLTSSRESGGKMHRLAGENFYYANHISNTLPLRFGGGASGYVLLIVYNMAEAKAGQDVAALNQALIIGVTVLGLSVMCWLFLSNALFSRMSRLVEASRRIGAGELRTPIQIDGNDEIATLGSSLDSMRMDLSEKQNQLILVAEDLELANATVERERALLAERVEERTLDLTIANKNLADAKEAAEAASRAKSAFLATVSHEIRTPMNGVLGAMELLERSGLEGQRAALLGTAQDSARALLGLLNDLLDMAKIEAGRIELVSAPASLEAIVDRVIATHEPAAIARQTQLVGNVGEDSPEWVAIDAFRVQQVLGNLVSNAVKFTNGGNVKLDATVENIDGVRCLLRFTVADNGAGISATTLGKLFRPFEQGAVEVARKSGGTGLGLAICRGLAKRMGGSVTLASEPGKGTTACFEIPAAMASGPRSGQSGTFPVDEAAIVHLKNCKVSNSANGVSILVVDDHPTNRLLQARQMEQLGADADTATDGIEALKKLREKHFDIVLTDCEMPEMDGFALARAIREADEPFRNIPIVACTAHALPDIGDRCRQNGMDAVLTKPMRLDELATVLRRFWPDSSAPPEVPKRPASEDLAVLDTSTLALLTGGDHGLRDTMLQAFLADFQQSVDEISEAIDANNHELCRQIAHRNKGACAVFGTLALGDAFADLEHWARHQPVNAADVGSIIQRLRAEGLRLGFLASEMSMTATSAKA